MIGDTLGVEEVKKAVSESGRRTRLGSSGVEAAAEGVAALRPEASEWEKRNRMWHLKGNKKTIEYWGAKNDPGFQIRVEIVPPGKKVDSKLSPEMFVLARLLTTGEYLSHMDADTAKVIVAERWAMQLFLNEGAKESHDLEEGRALTEDIVRQINSDELLEEPTNKREEYVKQVVKRANVNEGLKNALERGIKNLSQDEYDRWVAETIMEMVLKTRIKDLKAPSGAGRMTVGNELEVTGIRGRGVVEGLEKQLDLTEKFGGVPVTYDATRELPLPYSQGVRGQLRAIHSLFKMGLVPEGYLVGVHMNIGGADWHKGLRDALILCQILDAAVLTRMAAGYSQDQYSGLLGKKWRKEEIPGQLNKMFLEGDEGNSPSDIPARIRKSGVLELRCFCGFEDFNLLAKNLIAVEALAEGAAAGIRLRDRASKDIDGDKRLAAVWEYVKLESDKINKKYGINRDRYMRHVNYAMISEGAGEDFSKLRWKVLRQSALGIRALREGVGGDNYYVDYRKMILEARKLIREEQRT